MDFIPLIIEGYNMSTMIDEVVEEKQWLLSPLDRCDNDCNAEALVKVTGITGELMFCGHHYNKIMSTPDGYNSMMSFMITVLDERSKLNKQYNDKD